jgi:Protein of unknown function (DUF3822)
MLQSDFQYLENIGEKILSVVLMADSFFYGIFDENDNTLVCHKSFTDLRYSHPQSMDAILYHENLKQKFNKISVAALTDITFHSQVQDDSLLTLLPGLELKSKKVEKLPGNEIYSYYGITPHQEELLDNLFGSQNYILKSESALLSSYYMGNFDEFIHIHIQPSSIIVYVQRNGKLVFYNTFNTKGINDILYFVMAACQFANLKPESVQVKVSGWIEKDSLLYKNLCSYLVNIEIIENSQFKLSHYITTDIRPHYYFLHFIQALCAS